MDTDAPAVLLDGRTLTVEALVGVASGTAVVRVDGARLDGLAAGHRAMLAARSRGAIYGADTGVGANRHERIRDEAASEHGLRLLRSHCAATGPEEDDATARATMAVRLNQLLANASGLGPQLASGLETALQQGAVPHLHRWGAIGTADLSALAELGLTLVGERPWRSGRGPVVPIGPTDALPLISSNAVTIATAALAVAGLRELLQASVAVASLSFLALCGNAEAFSDVVHRARPHPGQADLAAQLHRLVSGGCPAARIQDPFGLRVLPQVLAPAVDAATRLEQVVTTELNAGVENPMVTESGVYHHGQFHSATLATALDTARAAMFPVLSLSAARLGLLLDPQVCGLRPFLAAGPPGSSGLLIGEYVVQDVLAELRPGLPPTTAATVSISRGVEEHASFATQGARALRRAVGPAPTVLAVELVAAVRALRMAPDRLGSAAAREVFNLAAAALDPDVADRPLGHDLERAAELLPLLGQLADERP